MKSSVRLSNDLVVAVIVEFALLGGVVRALRRGKP